MVRGCFTRVTVLADGQEALEEIPAEDAFIPNLAERNLYLQLGRGVPPPGMQSRPNAAVAAVLAAYPGLRAQLNAVPLYRCTSAALGCPWMAVQPGLSVSAAGWRGGVVVDKDWLERGVNRGSLLRHAVDISRQQEEDHVSWQADWADWQALGGQRNTRPYRPPTPFVLTPGCSCKAHHIKLDTQAIYGLMRTVGMLPADITSLTKFRNGVAGPRDSERYREYAAMTLVAWPAMWAELSKPRWSNASFRLFGDKQRTVAKF
ncbi:hypothetical protein QJQ45_011564 [Haematococcus lacustris]|nr:hypothetical protein QJQ45_011564 [Haematococcus lacustris]